MESVATSGWQRRSLGAGVLLAALRARQAFTQRGRAAPNARPHRAVTPSPMAPAGLPAGRTPKGKEEEIIPRARTPIRRGDTLQGERTPTR